MSSNSYRYIEYVACKDLVLVILVFYLLVAVVLAELVLRLLTGQVLDRPMHEPCTAGRHVCVT